MEELIRGPNQAEARGQGFLTYAHVRPHVYIAGPMLGVPNLNFESFQEAAKRWREWGYTVHSPAEEDVKAGVTMDQAEIARMYNEGDTPWIDRDIALIRSLRKQRGDRLAVLPGWRRSNGALAEVALARWMRLPVCDALSGFDVNTAEMFA